MADLSKSQDVCAFCGGTRTLRSFSKTYLYNGKTLEHYGNMLKKCFNIQWPNIRGFDKLCKNCVYQLRSASHFQSQVEKTYRRLFIKQEVDRSGVNLNIKLEEEDVKTEEPKQQLQTIVINNVRNIEVDQLQTIKQESIKEDFDDYGSMQDMPDGDSPLPFTNLSDDEWSVTSEEIKIATGFYRVVPAKKNNNPPAKPLPLDKSCKECPVCLSPFESRASLEAHYNGHFPVVLCDICGKSFTKNYRLLEHLRKHVGTRHKCKKCDKHYKTPHGLYQHFQRFHNHKLLFRCDRCGERFSTNIARKAHLDRVHNADIKTYPCQECGKTFYAHHALTRHTNGFHLKIKDFLCHLCDATFYCKSHLALHIKRHEGFTYPCEICGKALANPKSRSEHLKIHYDIKNHKCELCGKAFVQSTSLKWHIKSHHKVE